ncbi:TolC family protein [SAR116 cluster bacterium]|nr:TolC family protein [SAR116 cluster bacterium]
MSDFKLLFFAAIVFGMVAADPSLGQNSESSGITWSFDNGNETAVSADQEPPPQPVAPVVEFAAEPLVQSPLPSASLETPKDLKKITVQEIQKEISDAQALTTMEVVGESWPNSAKVVQAQGDGDVSSSPSLGSQTEELTDDNLRGDALASEMLANTTSSSELPSSIRQRTNALAVSSDAPAVLRSRHFSFDKLIVETLAVQDAVFEAEKGILSRRQDKKVVEGDYIPQANAEVFGQYHIWDNYRDFDPLDEYDLSLSTDWRVYDFGRKEMKYKSSDLSIDIAFNQLKTVQNDETGRLLKIYTDYSHQTEKMRLVEQYEEFLIGLQEEVEARIVGGVGTILEKNQFDQTLNSLRLRKLDASKLLQSAKSDYQLYFAAVFDEEILPSLDSFHVRTDETLDGIFRIDVTTPLEQKLKLEIEKAVLEKEIYASEYYPDVKVGLELKKYDLYDNDPDFEILATLTSKMTLFDGFKRQYSVSSKGEEIAGLAAKLRLTSIQKEQRVRRYQIEYENLQNEIENELVKIEKIQNDFDIAEDMTDLKALTFGERISFASDILTSQLRILENYYQQYEILIDVLSLKGGFSDMFEIEYASLRRTK